MAQTRMIQSELEAAGAETEITEITTKGDIILDKPLAEIGGKGLFTSAIETALLSREIDIAVHSAKDMPLALAEGTEIAAVIERGDPADVLVMRKGTFIDDVMTVGTGSRRRRNAFSAVFPGRVFSDIRGNVDTRLKKLEAGEYDGIILAAAGLERLGLRNDSRFSYIELAPEITVPTPCQGIIAVQSRQGELKELMKKICHKDTFLCYKAERAVMKLLDSGCNSPLGAYARIEDGTMILTVTLDSSALSICKGDPEDYEKIAREAVSGL